MARRRKFLAAAFSKRFEKSYARLTVAQQNGVDGALMALLKRQPTPGMRVKPIQPDKFYNEARINDGDRLVHRIEGDTLWVVDVVAHDDIDRHGEADPQAGRAANGTETSVPEDVSERTGRGV